MHINANEQQSFKPNLKYQPIKTLAPHATKHLLTGEELKVNQIKKLLQTAMRLKSERCNQQWRFALTGRHLALVFAKPSFRTRLSFTVAMRELGGDVIESVESTRKYETPEDQTRVLNGYCHAIMARVHEDSFLKRMQQVTAVPIINGLSNLHHPCQILADLLTLFEVFGSLKGLTVTYVGDGNNILHSLLLLAPQLGVNIHYSCPPGREPNKTILAQSIKRLKAKTGCIQAFATPQRAVVNADAVYTDIWTSMGSESRSAENLFTEFQVTEKLMAKAKPDAIFMHCMPMQRGKEVNQTLPDESCSVIFQQSENRLHIQKALLLFLLNGD